MVIRERLMNICETCPHMEVIALSTEVYADGKICGREITISCEHEHICKRLCDYVERSKNAAET